MYKTIYVDMDGVVADFNGAVTSILDREISWEGRDISLEEWNVIAKLPRFYYNLHPTYYANYIMENVSEYVKKASDNGDHYHLAFLSAMTERVDMVGMREDKIAWAKKHFPGIPVYFGPRSRDKQNWCFDSQDVLIDDKESNIVEWNSVGGIGILHLGDPIKTIYTFKTSVKSYT